MASTEFTQKWILSKVETFNPPRESFFALSLHSLSLKAQTRTTLTTSQRSEATCLRDGCSNQWSGWQRNWHSNASVGSNACRHWYFLPAADVPLFIVPQPNGGFKTSGSCRRHLPSWWSLHGPPLYSLMFNIWIHQTSYKIVKERRLRLDTGGRLLRCWENSIMCERLLLRKHSSDSLLVVLPFVT